MNIELSHGPLFQYGIEHESNFQVNASGGFCGTVPTTNFPGDGSVLLAQQVNTCLSPVLVLNPSAVFGGRKVSPG